MNLTIPYDLPPLSSESFFLTETVDVRLRDGSVKSAYYSHVLGVWIAEDSYDLLLPEDVMGWDDRGGDE